MDSDASDSDRSRHVKKRAADRACKALVLARPEPADDGSASPGCERQSTRASLRCTPRKTDAKGDHSLSDDDKDENEDFLLGGGLAKFYDCRTSFVKFFSKRITATDIASDNIFNMPDAAWAKVKDMEEAKECEYEEKRAAVYSARAAVKLLPSKICAWKMKDNISRRRLDVKGKLDDAVRAHEDWLEAIEATKKLTYKRLKVLNRMTRAIKVSHDKLTESLVDAGVHDAPAKFLAHDMNLAKHAKPQDHLGSSGSFMFGVICLGFSCRCFG